jgi:hypothetical protein
MPLYDMISAPDVKLAPLGALVLTPCTSIIAGFPDTPVNCLATSTGPGPDKKYK